MDVIAVDDDRAGRELLRLVLEAAGHAVRTGASASDALGLLAASSRPAVLVTDLLMGVARDEGYLLIERVRSDPRLDAVGIIALTGVTSGRDLARARAAGADACLTKPIDVPRFLDVLDEVRAARGPAPGSA